MDISAVEYPKISAPLASGLFDLGNRLSPLPQIELLGQTALQRPEVECYIRDKFLRSYSAEIVHFLPQLLSMRCAGHLTGAAGIAIADRQPHLFLEHYLDVPIEAELGRLGLPHARRAEIAEIGNLVATTTGSSRVVFIVLASLLHRLGLHWMVFTATGPLFATLQRLGFSLHRICPAEVARLPASAQGNWGTYYEQRPEVVAGQLDDAMKLIASRPLFLAIQQLCSSQIDTLVAEFEQMLESRC